jgi:hypothetical protein
VRPREALTSESALALQRTAGNAALTTLLEHDRAPAPTAAEQDRFARVQRDEVGSAATQPDYAKPGGVPVEKSGMTRVVVTGLSYGVKGGHQDTYLSWRGARVPSSE